MSGTLRRLGFWCSASQPDWPDPKDLVDAASYDELTRDILVHYLEGGQRVPWAYGGPSFCRLCDQPNGAGEFTDGTFIWPEGLAHYVRDHFVRLPDEVVTRALSWAAPESWEGRIDDSWWKGYEGHG